MTPTTAFRPLTSSSLSSGLPMRGTGAVDGPWAEALAATLAWWADCWRGLFAPDAPKANPLPQASRTARYRHPVSGQSWDGHGRQPHWMQQAVLVEGYNIDALRRAARQGWISRG